mmetsp:Transcript_67398/g.186793  ORF Transcript_67398/g.186793 Transcript_67398/m.186793 type:complete len:209 (+) Transcript_67398:145-771(+)
MNPLTTPQTMTSLPLQPVALAKFTSSSARSITSKRPIRSRAPLTAGTWRSSSGTAMSPTRTSRPCTTSSVRRRTWQRWSSGLGRLSRPMTTSSSTTQATARIWRTSRVTRRTARTRHFASSRLTARSTTTAACRTTTSPTSSQATSPRRPGSSSSLIAAIPGPLRTLRPATGVAARRFPSLDAWMGRPPATLARVESSRTRCCWPLAT